MSDTVRSYGFIAVLKTPVTEDREAFSEKLWDSHTDLDITYAGDLAFIDYNRHASRDERTDIYGLSFGGITPEGNPAKLINEARKFGLEVDPTTLRSYNCIWYNGGDNPVSMLTKDKFLAQTSQPSDTTPFIPNEEG